MRMIVRARRSRLNFAGLFRLIAVLNLAMNINEVTHRVRMHKVSDIKSIEMEKLKYGLKLVVGTRANRVLDNSWSDKVDEVH